jgi:hypothetical protein
VSIDANSVEALVVESVLRAGGTQILGVAWSDGEDRSESASLAAQLDALDADVGRLWGAMPRALFRWQHSSKRPLPSRRRQRPFVAASRQCRVGAPCGSVLEIALSSTVAGTSSGWMPAVLSWQR